VALNTALMHRRGRSRRPPTIPLDDPSFRSPAAPDRAPPDDVHHLYAAIAELAPLDRAVAVLKLEDRSLQEIADVTGLSAGAVSVRLVRITEKLRRALGVSADADKEKP
jgi:RNA polymerase sigma-70 factor (ECF subfamily)